jgi:uncharacterized membrane protein
MKILITVVLLLISVVYPVIVYFGMEHISPATFSLILSAMALLRFVITRGWSDVTQIPVLIAVLLFSAGLLITGDQYWLKLYPVVISASIAAIFALSLRNPESLIERVARLRGADITPRARHYTKRLTLVWAILLTVNALVSLYLAEFADMKAWALYCGFISYVIIGCFFAAELLYRRYYIAKYGA